MPAATKKTAPVKVEIELEQGSEKEGESEEMDMDEVREGGMNYGKTNRKRSAKGAKNTKPAKDGYAMKKPMDAECSCGMKGRKGKCDGSCGKKMDSALTPQEYLAACDLGVQGRSRSYIRARLDSAQRLDLKCGRGAISEGEKCRVGQAQKVEPTDRYSIKGRAKAEAKAGAIKGALLGAAGGYVSGALTGRRGSGLAQAALGAGAGALYGATAGAARGAAGAALNRTGRAYMRNRQNVKNANAELKKYWEEKGEQEYNQAYQSRDRNVINKMLIKQAGEVDRLLNRNKTQIWTNANRPLASAQKARPRRGDSVYASGFTPDYDALAI